MEKLLVGNRINRFWYCGHWLRPLGNYSCWSFWASKGK
ncbi:hypothetical protein [Klebsiella phage vB_KshKPC-M]|nr:hypothetical protein [Klebsiella phage vB_KshKPC-M]